MISDNEQAEKVADYFCAVRQNFDAVSRNEIAIPPFDEDTVPQFKETDVSKKLAEVNPKK